MGLCRKGVYLRNTPLNFKALKLFKERRLLKENKRKEKRLEKRKQKYILQYPFKNLTIIKI
jgi:hypothetical protein